MRVLTVVRISFGVYEGLGCGWMPHHMNTRWKSKCGKVDDSFFVVVWRVQAPPSAHTFTLASTRYYDDNVVFSPFETLSSIQLGLLIFFRSSSLGRINVFVNRFFARLFKCFTFHLYILKLQVLLGKPLFSLKEFATKQQHHHHQNKEWKCRSVKLWRNVIMVLLIFLLLLLLFCHVLGSVDSYAAARKCASEKFLIQCFFIHSSSLRCTEFPISGRS